MTQDEALAILKSGANVFVTGEPGSGKTHIIHAFIAWLRARNCEPAKTAATGIAATHIGGMTIHAWSGIGVSHALSAMDIDRIASRETVARRIRKAHVLLIEEVSMLSGETLDMVDRVCKEARHDTRPFGGLTVVFIGDFFQLPPVQKKAAASFAYQSDAWNAANPLVCYLTSQYRQDDRAYLALLSAIRAGNVGPEETALLESRRVLRDADGTQALPKLFSHNDEVDRLNAESLARIPGMSRVFQMRSKGKEAFVEGLKRGCLSPERLELKAGAAVMFTKNAPQGTFVNGTLGTVSAFSIEGLPVVETRSGARITVEPMEWQYEENGAVRASVSQVPLRLAYALTVHKSQGMSMDAAVIDLSRSFEYGQGYVALSRLRRLSGLYLLGFNTRSLEVHPESLAKDAAFRALSEAAQETFSLMSAEEKRALHKRFIAAIGGIWVEEGAEQASSKGTAGRPSSVPARLVATRDALSRVRSLGELAKERALTVSTVLKHLEELARMHLVASKDIAALMPPEPVIKKITYALGEEKTDRLAPVFSRLGGQYPFETIRLVRLSLRLEKE